MKINGCIGILWTLLLSPGSWAKNFVLIMGADEPSITTSSQCEPTDFDDPVRPRICLDTGQFWSSGLNKLRGPLSEVQVRLLIHYMAEIYEAPFDPLLANPVGMQKLAAALTEKNIEEFAYPIFEHLAPLVKPDVLAAMDIGRWLSLVRGEENIVRILNRLGGSPKGTQVIWKEAPSIVELLKDRKIWLERLDEPVVKALISNLDACSGLNNPLLASLGRSAALAKHLTGQCLGAIARLRSYTCELGVRNWPLAALRPVRRLHASCMRLMSPEQIEAFSALVPTGARPCASVKLHEQVLLANGKLLTPHCFAGALESQTTDATAIHRAWSILRVDILSELPHRPELPELLGKLESEWPHISMPQKAIFFNDPKLCSDLPERGPLRYHVHTLELSDDCFRNLQAGNQVDALMHANSLSDTALARLTMDQVRNWKDEESGTSGLAVLDFVRHRDNLWILVENLSVQAEGGAHACQLIETIGMLEEATVIQQYAERKCFEAMGKGLLADFRKCPSFCSLHPNAREHIEAIIREQNEG